MRRPSPWLTLVVILLGVLIVRDPRLRQVDDFLFERFAENAESTLPPAALTLIEIGREDFQGLTPLGHRRELPKGEAVRRSLSPLEYALFLQAALAFQPAVIAIEPLLVWRTEDKVQEQVLLDQAMRVPKLLVALELGGKGSRELAPEDLTVLPNVTGPRGYLPEFFGIARQPDDDIRLISSPGLVAPSQVGRDRMRVPMLFEYRGEVVASFPLEAILLWLRATPAEARVELGSQIVLPNGWKIPLHRDGTMTINPGAQKSVRRLRLDDLLLAAQEQEHQRPFTRDLRDLKNQILVLRLEGDQLQPSNVFSTAIATILTNAYVRAASATVSWIIILILALLASLSRLISRSNFFLGAIALSAGYALVDLGFISQYRIWLPLLLPLTLLWFIVVVRLFDREANRPKHEQFATG